MIHALTIDVEDAYNLALRQRMGVEGPPTEAVIRNTDRLLALLEDRGARATFFVLGEVAEAFPRLLARIAAAGHELGVHGQGHQKVFALSPRDFRQQVRRARRRVADAAGAPADGHRAPAFSIGPDQAWALEVLAEEGFRYDSSVFPFRGRRYGWAGFPRDIHRLRFDGGRTLVEAPLSVVPVGGRVLPACGGGYLRHLPYAYTRWAMRRVGRVRPAIVYIHPYDLDAEPARAPAVYRRAMARAGLQIRRQQWMQRRNRQTVPGKLTALLDEFRFAPLGEVIDRVLAGRPATAPAAR